MKRSETTSEILESLKDPENIYSFEEDEKEARLGFAYIRSNGWDLQKGLTEEQRKEVEKYIQQNYE